jgi:hypothetical protein
MKKLLADGKTDLLKEFVSNRTRRKFSAYLVNQNGKVGFEFEKKAPAAKKPPKKKAKPPSKTAPGRWLKFGRRAANGTGAFHVKPQRWLWPGQWQDNSAARTASIACGRGR